MSVVPKPFLDVTEEELDLYASIFRADREMLSLLRLCPVCDGPILVCDNGWLDARPGPRSDDTWVVLTLGPLHMMASAADGGGSQHHIHEHQPS